MSNMTYSLVYRFIPKSEERKAFLRTAEDVAKMYNVSIILGKNGEVTLAGMVASEVAPLLIATGLSPYAEWPRDIVTCDIETPLPLRAVGMEDGWEIFVADHVFIGFVSLADDAIEILERAGSFYTRKEKFETLPEFVERIGLEEFRREVLGVNHAQTVTVPEFQPTEYTSGGEFFDLSLRPNFEYEMPQQEPTLHYGDFVRPEDNLMDILMVYPEMGPFFLEYGMHCIGCSASYNETIWEACQVHGLDIFEMLGEMNEYLADKLGKELISGDTALQELFTMYPQTLAILHDYGIQLPDDMNMTLAALTKEQQVSLDDLLDQVHRVLRKE